MRRRNDPIDELARIDPIDGRRIADIWSSSDAGQALLREITTMSIDTIPAAEAASPAANVKANPVWRRGLELAVGLAVAALTLVVAQGLLSGGSAAFAVRQLPGGVIEIDAMPQFRDGEALAAELGEFGIDVEIETVPSSPSMVGEVEVFATGGGDYIPEGLSFGADGTPDVFNLRIDPSLFTEHLTLRLYVAAEEGERYQSAQEVFEPGEVLAGLHCGLGAPVRAEALLPYLADLGLAPVWTVVSPTDDPSITDSEQVQEVPAGEVIAGYALDSATVEFQVVRDGVTLSAISTPRLSDVACAPEDAARWK